MSSFNKVLLMGNLTRDPQVRQLPAGGNVAEFGLAVNRRYRTQAGEEREEVLFVDCSVFGKQADVIHQYCRKGKPLFIEGRLRYDTWEDKIDGTARSKISVVVEHFQFLASREQNNAGTPAPASTASRDPGKTSPETPSPRSHSARKRPTSGKLQFKEADIPF